MSILPRLSARPRQTLVAVAIVAAVSFGAFAVYVNSTEANTPAKFIVNSSQDAPDAVAGDGVCDTVPGPPIVCTLRAAIEEANALNGANVINFTHTNTVLGSNLPTITERLTIDASANPAGFSIDATGAGTDGLTLGVGSSDSVIRGLNIFDAPGDGLVIIGGASHTIGGDPSAGAAPTGQGNAFHGNGGDGIDIHAGSLGGHTIVGNRIGTVPDGLSPDGNLGDGINVGGGTDADITIGGFPNLISANANTGVDAVGGTPDVIIQNNWIGLNANGTASDPFANVDGIHLHTNDNTVLNNRIAGGGVVPSDNPGLVGIFIAGDANTIMGNCIGFNSDCDGTAGGFDGRGIDCFGGDDNIIGDGTDAGRNVIGNTDDEAIILDDCNGNDVNGNYIGFGGDGEEGAVINDDCVELGPAPADDNQIRNNLIGNCDFEAIDIDNGDDNVIEGNDIGRGTDPATSDDINEFCIELDGNSNLILNNVMANCNADFPDATIQITSGSFNVIQGNDITSPVGEDAIDVQGAGIGNLIASDIFRMLNQGTGDLPIDLIGVEGTDLNDARDVDAGTNLLHNYPVFPPTSPTDGCARGTAGPFDEVRIYAKSTEGNVTIYELMGSGFANVAGDFTVCINNTADVTVVGTATVTLASTTDIAGPNSTSEFSLTEQVVQSAGTATPTSTATPTPTDTPEDRPRQTPTPIDTPTATPTATPTLSPTPCPGGVCPTDTPTATPTATPTPTATSTPTATPTGSSTPTFTPTLTQTPTLTHTPSATASVSPTVTPTGTSIPPVFVTTTPTPFSEVSPTVVPPGNVLGDVNCDGGVDSIDAFFVLWFEAGVFGIFPCTKNADANQDGLINSLDALVILQFHAFLLPGLPPPQFAGETWAEQLSSWLAGLW